jgi:hypothetical protein
MAQITFEPGDKFQWHISPTDAGVGIVLRDGYALLIKGEGGRTGYKTLLGTVPPGAIPLQGTPEFEISFALNAAAIACNLPGAVNRM